MHHHSYVRLAAMAVLSFIAMYILMYAMVDRFAHVWPNINQVYMAGLMTAPMIVIELLLMSAMYKNSAANLAIGAASVILGIACFAAVRAQIAVGDVQFLKSMIPHHSGAILMCEQAPVSDPEIKTLCGEIIKGQQEEIDLMTRMLAAK